MSIKADKLTPGETYGVGTSSRGVEPLVYVGPWPSDPRRVTPTADLWFLDPDTGKDAWNIARWVYEDQGDTTTEPTTDDFVAAAARHYRPPDNWEDDDDSDAIRVQANHVQCLWSEVDAYWEQVKARSQAGRKAALTRVKKKNAARQAEHAAAEAERRKTPVGQLDAMAERFPAIGFSRAYMRNTGEATISLHVDFPSYEAAVKFLRDLEEKGVLQTQTEKESTP